MKLNYSSLAISGLPGSGKSAIANSLREYLLERGEDWNISSIGELWRIRHKKERPDISFEDYWKNHTSLEDNRNINKEFLELVRSKQVRIADTRYAHIYGSQTLKVYVECDINLRAQRAFGSEKYKGKSVHQIRTILERREEDEVQKGKEIFGDSYDFRSWKYYDAILDNDGKVIDSLDIILEKLVVE